MRIIVFANGQYESSDFYKEYVNEEDLVFAADGGANIALEYGIIPDQVIGDLDSITDLTYKELKEREVVFKKVAAEKDESDLELTLNLAYAMEPEEVIVFGALGKRVDHLLANVFLLTKSAQKGITTRIVDEQQSMWLITEKSTIQGSAGDYVSLFSLTQEVQGVTTWGMKYPLEGETLFLGPSRGLSNELLQNRGGVSIKSGKLLVIHTCSA